MDVRVLLIRRLSKTLVDLILSIFSRLSARRGGPSRLKDLKAL